MTGMHTLKTALTGSVAAIALLAAGVPAQGAEGDTATDDLREMIEAQQEELDRMRERLQEVETTQEEQETVAPAQAVTAGDIHRSFKIPGTKTSLSIGGYIKADLFYDVDEDLGDSFAASAISPDVPGAVDNDGTFRAHAKQSRLWFKTSTPTEMGDLKTHLEGDFLGAGGNEKFSNSTTFRLRHAYGQLGGLLVGQTWTNFMSLHSYADTVDFFGPAGMPFVRQVQLRYTFTPVDSLQISVAVENREACKALETAVRAQPGDAEYLCDLGRCLESLGDGRGAERRYRAAVNVDPALAAAHYNLGVTLQNLGRFDEEASSHRRAIELQPSLADAWYSLSMNDSADVTGEELYRMKGLLDQGSLKPAAEATLRFALARALDRRDKVRAACAEYRQANRIREDILPFNAEAHLSYIDRLIRTFDKPFFDERRN